MTVLKAKTDIWRFFIVAIRNIPQNQCEEYINMNINLPDLDFVAAKQAAKEKGT